MTTLEATMRLDGDEGDEDHCFPHIVRCWLLEGHMVRIVTIVLYGV